MTFVTTALSACPGVVARKNIAVVPSCSAHSSAKLMKIAPPTVVRLGIAALRMCAWGGKRLAIIARTTTNASLKYALWRMTHKS